MGNELKLALLNCSQNFSNVTLLGSSVGKYVSACVSNCNDGTIKYIVNGFADYPREFLMMDIDWH